MKSVAAMSCLATATILLAVAFALVPSTVSAEQVRQPSVAYKMAAIDCTCVPSARTVAQYQRVLLRLVTRKCKETPLKLADEIVNTRDILAKDGYGHFKLLRLLRLLDSSITNNIHFRQPCRGVLAALIVLIEHK